MARPIKSVTRSVRLTPEECARYDRLVGYRGLWTWSEVVAAGLDMLAVEAEAAARAAAEEVFELEDKSKRKKRKP